MRGPKPKPAGVRDQRAAVRSKRTAPVVDAIAVVSIGGVSPPPWLTGEGLAEWNRRAGVLHQAKLLTAADVTAFARYCRNLALWVKLRAEMDTQGAVYESESNHGKLKRAHPAFLIADRLERQLLATEDRFGLNPSERQRIMAARAQTGVSGDLFGGEAPQDKARPTDDAAAKPAAPAKPLAGPLGMLN